MDPKLFVIQTLTNAIIANDRHDHFLRQLRIARDSATVLLQPPLAQSDLIISEHSRKPGTITSFRSSACVDGASAAELLQERRVGAQRIGSVAVDR